MKKALIVDDSRLARTVLSRLLTEHGVATDTAESAEAALDYLKHNRPDVVFLDHNMPGIDGFQALDAIKTNPSTATIPVMMYTSEQGEVYVGQARALGAIGVLPKALHPVEVVSVLRKLHLIPGPVPEQPVATPAPVAEPAAPLPFDERPLDAARLRELLEPLFSEHTITLREEMRRGLQRVAAATAQPPPAAATVIPPPLEPPLPRSSNRQLRIASALLLVVAATFVYLYFATRAALDEANERVQRLANDTATLSDARLRSASPSQSTAPNGVLAVLEWGVNRGNSYAFGAVPLDDERATMLASLVEQLERLGFTGRVAIETHVGRFCMNYGSDGMLDLAPPDQPAATCEQVGWPENEAVALGQRQSLAFANTMASAMARNPNVRVEIFSRGSDDPALDYPDASYELTAGAWNTVAAANHRVNVRLISAPAGAAARR